VGGEEVRKVRHKRIGKGDAQVHLQMCSSVVEGAACGPHWRVLTICGGGLLCGRGQAG
jgi:hypothetical protein